MEDKSKVKDDKVKNKDRFTGRLKLGSFLILLFLLLYIPSLIFWVYGKNISTDIIRIGELEDSLNVDAYIVRDERAINSPLDGISIRVINEGEKIKAGDTIATVLNKSSEKLLDDLKTLDLRIIKAQKEKSENDDFFSEDVRKLDKEIEEKLMLVIAQGNSNSLSKAKVIKSEIDGLIQKKASITGSLSSSDAYIKSLKKEKSMLQGRVNENTKNIDSNSPGIISYIVDGYEELLNPEKIFDLTPKDLEGIKIRENNKDMDDLSVEYNKPFVKVIKGIDYYTVFVMDKKRAGNFKVDDSLGIRINDIDKVVPGIVSYKSNEIEGKYVIAVKSDRALSETAALRKINIDLIKKYYDGLRVPVKSLINIDLESKKAQIALVRANRAKFVPVRIIGRNNEFAIIDNIDEYAESGISLYSSYIINPKNIEEGQIIN